MIFGLLQYHFHMASLEEWELKISRILDWIPVGNLDDYLLHEGVYVHVIYVGGDTNQG